MHIRMLVETKQAFFQGSIMSTDLYRQGQVARISRELENFVHFYQGSYPSPNALVQSRKDCEFFQEYPFYENLVRIWDHACHAQSGGFDSRNNVSISMLEDTLTRNRTLLEELSTDNTVIYLNFRMTFRSAAQRYCASTSMRDSKAPQCVRGMSTITTGRFTVQ
jgi:hypothetical protein